MKNKKLIFIIVCIVIALAFLLRSYSSANHSPDDAVSNKQIENRVENTNQSNTEDEAKPARQEIEGAIKNWVDKTIQPNREPDTAYEAALPKKELEGKITNEYGIRDDIYHFITDNIPESNHAALISAIKLAQYTNQIYYHSTNQKEALELSKKEALSSWCLVLSLPKTWEQTALGMNKLMRNTPERHKYMRYIDTKYFAWQILGSGLTDSEERERCQSGSF